MMRSLSVGILIAALAPLSGCAHHSPAVRSAPILASSLGAPPVIAKPARALTVAHAKKKRDDAIYFNFDSDILEPGALPELRKVGKRMLKHPEKKVEIDGNCDERGTEAYNIALGEQRAQAAKRYLERLGVAKTRIATLSYGKDRPKFLGHDESSWSKNRRDDFLVR